MLRDLARKYALQNAVLHGGRADAKAVTKRILAEEPALRAQELSPGHNPGDRVVRRERSPLQRATLR